MQISVGFLASLMAPELFCFLDDHVRASLRTVAAASYLVRNSNELILKKTKGVCFVKAPVYGRLLINKCRFFAVGMPFACCELSFGTLLSNSS